MDALGDELLADEDSSYLDEAASAPAIPEGVPTDTKNKVSFSLKVMLRLLPVVSTILQITDVFIEWDSLFKIYLFSEFCLHVCMYTLYFHAM